MHLWPRKSVPASIWTDQLYVEVYVCGIWDVWNSNSEVVKFLDFWPDMNKVNMLEKVIDMKKNRIQAQM